jgi:glutathione S-transferase
MARLVLVIGNKNYSSWSLRPWLALRMAGLAFEEERIALYEPATKQAILRHSPAGKVPVLRHGKVTVFESLAMQAYADAVWALAPLREWVAAVAAEPERVAAYEALLAR